MESYCCYCCCWVASVVSDSVRPHRRQPTRLPRPWDSPGKNTGVGCHFLLHINLYLAPSTFFLLHFFINSNSFFPQISFCIHAHTDLIFKYMYSFMPVGILSTALFSSPFSCKPAVPLLPPNHINDFEWILWYFSPDTHVYVHMYEYKYIHTDTHLHSLCLLHNNVAYIILNIFLLSPNCGTSLLYQRC